MMRVGQVIRFLYPRANYRTAREKLERRVLRVDQVLANPAPLEAVNADPLLIRDGALVCGEDLDKHEPRSFYAGRMSDVETVELLPETTEYYRLVLIERDSGRERLPDPPVMEQHRALAFIGAFNGASVRSRAEAREVRLPAVVRDAAGKIS